MGPVRRVCAVRLGEKCVSTVCKDSLISQRVPFADFVASCDQRAHLILHQNPREKGGTAGGGPGAAPGGQFARQQ
jgi:hypothetical protein